MAYGAKPHTIVSTKTLARGQPVTNRRNLLALGLCLMAFTLSNASQAGETVGTNLQGVVIKEFRCVGASYLGNVVNRSQQRVQGTMFVKVYDKDGDPVGSCRSPILLGPESGNSFSAGSCNCMYAKSVKITIR